MTLLTVLLHIWILWTLHGDKVTADPHQICCSHCYSGTSSCIRANNECVILCVPLKNCMSAGLYEGCQIKSSTGAITESILESQREGLCNNRRCFCCRKDCSNYPSLNQYTCMDDSGGSVICCTNSSITASISQQTNKSLFSSNTEMSTSLISSFPLSVISNRMSSSQEKVISWSGQNPISRTIATSHFSIHVILPPAESSKFNQNIIFALVGGLGGSIIVLVVSVIIIVQCVTLYRRRKVEACSAVREGHEENENSIHLYSPLPRSAEVSPYECPVTSNSSCGECACYEADNTTKYTYKEVESDEDDYAEPDDNILNETQAPQSSHVLSKTVTTHKTQSSQRVHFATPDYTSPSVKKTCEEHIYAVLEKRRDGTRDVSGLEKETHYTLPKLRSDDGCSSPIKEKCLKNEK